MNEEQHNQSTMLSDISQKKRIRQKYFSHSLKKDVLEPLRDDAMYSSSLISSKSDALKDESTGNKQDRDENKLDHNCYIRDPGRQRKHTYATHNVARGIADSVPEVHFIGEIVGGISFNHSPSISCKFTIEWGKCWSFLEGEYNGQTQFSCINESNRSVWNHPIDIHLASANVKGWPRIFIQINSLDQYGDDVISGYGFTHLPTTVGRHNINIPCWRPKASTNGKELQNHFFGELIDHGSMDFSDELQSRHKLTTIASGQVHLQLYSSQRFF